MINVHAPSYDRLDLKHTRGRVCNMFESKLIMASSYRRE
jgi:hypothetical protein